MQTRKFLGRSFAIVVFMLGCVTTAKAQGWHAALYTGYVTQAIDLFGPDRIRIPDGSYNGIEGEYMLDQNFGVKLSYGRQVGKVALLNGTVSESTRIERYELGFSANKAIGTGKLCWNSGIGFGLCNLSSEKGDGEVLKFGTSFNTGLTWHITRFVGLQTQARVLQFYSNAGSEPPANNATVNDSGMVISQVSLTAGLIFSIGK